MRLVPLLIAALMSPGAAPSAAASPPTSGYWWAGETGVASAPAPPNVPDKGLYVASSVTGATAVSAIGFTLPVDRTNPTLVLKVHQLQKGDSFIVDAYPTSSKWSPGNAQTWSTRPVPAPHALPIHGMLSPDGTTVTFALSAVAPGGHTDLVLVPGTPNPVATGAPAAPSPTFDASFEPLTGSSVLSTQVQQQETVTNPNAESAVPPFRGTVSAAAPPALGAPLVPATRPVPEQPSVAPSVTPSQPLAGQPLPTAAVTAAPGRSSQETALLVLLLVGTTFYLGWLGRSQTTGAGRRPSLYDLPAAVDDRA